MMGHREKSIDADELDAFTKWRHYVFWQRGERKRIKRKFNKRVRKAAKMELRRV